MGTDKGDADLTRVFLFDMDGSLADFDGSLRLELERMRGPEEPPTDLPRAWQTPHLRARIEAVRSRPGWWAQLPPLEAGMRVYRKALEIGFDCQVLTKGPKGHSRAWAEKVDWCKRWLGPDVDVHIVSDKGLVYGRALYDDHPPYVEAWLRHRPRGLVVMPVNALNRDFRHPNVLPYDGENFDAVERAMRVVAARRPGEELRLA
jgi:5'-nucleotidase